MRSLKCYSDGGSRGNPGPSAYATVITENDRIIFRTSKFLGIHTNNFAEYSGLIANIRKCIELGADRAEFIMDSQLVVRQMTGRYKVKSPGINLLYQEARDLCEIIPCVRFINVRRSELLIPFADALLNAEMDRQQMRCNHPRSLI